MMRNICCGFIKTQHKSSRNFRQKRTATYTLFFLIKFRLHSYNRFKNHEIILFVFKTCLTLTYVHFSSSSSTHENLLFFLFFFFNLSLLQNPRKLLLLFFKTHAIVLGLCFFLRYNFFFKTHENCYCSSSFFYFVKIHGVLGFSFCMLVM